jgi:hypothetical protein
MNLLHLSVLRVKDVDGFGEALCDPEVRTALAQPPVQDVQQA